MTPLREQYKILFGYNDELRTIVESVLDHHRHPQNLREGFLLFAFGKAYKTHAAILILCAQGYGEDASVLARTLFELAISSHYIHSDGTGRNALRFFEYDWVIREKMYARLSKSDELKKAFEKRLANSKAGDISVDDIMREAKRVRDGYTKDERGKGWSGKTMKEMAEIVGRSDAYETAYFLQCNIAHSAVSTAQEYMREDGEEISMDVSPNENWVPQTLVMSIDFFLGIVEAWNAAFGLNLEDKLDDFKNRYTQEVGKINAANE